MKVTQKQLEEMVLEVAGQEGLQVYRVLKGKENLNEFLIAEKVKLTINQVRNVLYKFESLNLVTSTRKKDRKKGWYIYFWTFVDERGQRAFVEMKKRRMQQFEARLERERAHQFYLCVNKCTRTSVEAAMENQFMCAECGQLMVPEDNSKTIRRIGDEIEVLRLEIQKLEAPEHGKKRVELVVAEVKKQKRQK
ncbi:MAG TPA: hypothetical protein VFE88_00825 [Candidatus Nanoarchaeia archaeon]|nr:hypothetical protein [Candidatus Nanoarchaeia archaeon]